MVLLIALLALLAWATVATVLELRRDGFRRLPTDWTRVAEHDAPHQRAATGHIYR